MNEQIFELIENTHRNVFLTGKAGTGKTTFLNHFVKKTSKNHIIVAPTGIAAINAGGVTIHSMFGLPLRPFVPTIDRIDTNLANNITDLLPHFRYHKEKLKLLRELEIIIIDEVSMLRADVLDMMDFALKSARRNQQKFGGVQMLFIGDLFQLPPVLREEHEAIFQQYYASPFFFDAKALESMDLITIELTEVFRQKDKEFLELLNSIREGNIKEIDFHQLNERYQPDFEPPKGEAFVHLCSHNRIADKINQQKIKELKTDSFFYKALIYGDFKESQYPNDEILELKVGAQVMFIRNDTSLYKRYYNGKLAKVSHLTEESIFVILEESGEEIEVTREVWELKKYKLREDKKIEEDVVGSFKQYPIRLAWAVTIHKSQGLTFDKLIIDAGQSFTSGQVYVALSRCRTLEGIYLKSKITPSVIFNDKRVSVFQKNTNANEKMEQIIEAEKYDYNIKKTLKTTNCQWINYSLEEWHQIAQESKKLDPQKISELYIYLKNQLKKLVEIYTKFDKVLQQKTSKFANGLEDWQEIENKAKGGVNFFFENVKDQIFEPLKQFYAETKTQKGLKEHYEFVKNWLEELEDYLQDLKRTRLLNTPLFNADNDTEISSKIAKIPTHIITYKLFEEGKNIEQIANERGLTLGTIVGHLAKFAEQGVLDLKRIISEEKIKIFSETYQKTKKNTLNEWKDLLPEDFSFHEIRLLWNYHQYLSQKE